MIAVYSKVAIETDFKFEKHICEHIDSCFPESLDLRKHNCKSVGTEMFLSALNSSTFWKSAIAVPFGLQQSVCPFYFSNL